MTIPHEPHGPMTQHVDIAYPYLLSIQQKKNCPISSSRTTFTINLDPIALV